MPLDNYLLPPSKRRRFVTSTPDSMELDDSKSQIAIANEKYGREVRVFETSALSLSIKNATADDNDEFYDFTPDDYFRLLASKKQEKYLKTKKIRDAEEAARRSKITKCLVRVRFPDNHTLEATFHPSETLRSLFDLVNKVIAQPEMPFYIYTTPPKRQINDLDQDFYGAGFVPGAIVYFSYEKSNDPKLCSFLREDVLSLKNMELAIQAAESEPIEEVASAEVAASEDVNPVEKKPLKPKWFKM